LLLAACCAEEGEALTQVAACCAEGRLQARKVATLDKEAAKREERRGREKREERREKRVDLNNKIY
jgi:hypothetical protein